jgi:hypothetical protein
MSVAIQELHETVTARLASSRGTKVINFVATGALLRAGEYVLYGESNWICMGRTEKEPCFGQIIDIANYRDIPSVEVADMLASPLDQYALIRLTPLASRDILKDQRDYPCVPTFIHEVQCSATLHWISVKELKVIAFVFHVHQVNDFEYSCDGIRNAYIIRSTVLEVMMILSLPLTRMNGILLSLLLVTVRVTPKEFGIALPLSRNCAGGA